MIYKDNVNLVGQGRRGSELRTYFLEQNYIFDETVLSQKLCI